jgi:competence protein ComFC
MSAYKYNGIRELGNIVGNLCKSRFNILENTILTIIPLSKQRESQRGFNQVDLLAQKLLSQINRSCIYLPDLLIRQFDNSNQAHLPKELRHYNIENIFRINSKYNLNSLGKYNVLILDDVVTTGSTLIVAGKVLKAAGFKQIYGFALFRGEPRFNSKIRISNS